MYDIIVIGAGMAGLTAAIYGRRANKKVLVLEKMSYGGQIINALDIENYPGLMHISGFDLATKVYNQAKELGVDFKFEKVTNVINGKVKTIVTEKNKYKALSIIIATGVNQRKLNILNEEKFVGKGISYCATCDGMFYKNKIVAVVGGGNTACEDALYLSNICKDIYLIHRRDTFRADNKIIDLLKQKNNVHFVYNSVITKLLGTDKLEKIEIKTNDKINEITIDGLFIAIGHLPETLSFDKIIKLDESGYVLAKDDCHTNKKGIFVAGDIRAKELRQLVTATSDGAIAANEAINYLKQIS